MSRISYKLRSDTTVSTRVCRFSTNRNYKLFNQVRTFGHVRPSYHRPKTGGRCRDEHVPLWESHLAFRRLPTNYVEAATLSRSVTERAVLRKRLSSLV